MSATRTTFPLTHPQQRIFLVQVLHPGTPVWNVPYGVRADGALDVDAMRRALDLVVAEFDALRIRFTEVDGETRQYVVEPYPVPLDVVELEHPGERGYEAWAAAFATEPIWALDAPLIRVACARISDRRWGLVFKLHHIIGDGSGALNTLSRLLERGQSGIGSGAG